ncbi:hypothetical protein [Cerasicoccus arenae]|uniref:Uncharacterized protein n=1 Tax=Cerasicoccus arenae TaxID=424488 RepID=A0A8J3GDZ2_9BACT|nr:hypothetical protein [Cerasicoccus arenae]MBK1856726.1 hypothetical protein [Cerasicoccus arenae]GHB99151.1 hypothetical protein GCM10007047_14080 [Cerasicoccus arenae]
MRKFICEIVKFVSIQAVITVTILSVFFGIPEKYHYLASTEDKAFRFYHAESPRLILIGDSGVAYGMKSDILAKQFPQFTVVNMALMAGLGFRNIMAEVEEDLRPGDVVVMIFAHQVFDRNILHYQYWNYIAYRPEMLKRMKWRDVPFLMDNSWFIFNRALHVYRRIMTWKLHPPRDGPVNRAGFDEYGDLIAHHGGKTVPGTKFEMVDLKLDDPRFSKEVVKEMNAFADTARAHGAQVYYMFPAIPDVAWEANGEKIREAAAYAIDGLNFPVINSVEEMVYPASEFYDTNYHMLGEGATRRTKLLAERLQEQFDQEEKSK